MTNYTITKAELNNLSDCKVALLNSKLGDELFPSEKKAHDLLKEGINNGEIYAAIDQDNSCLGFIKIIWEGMFNVFPMVHIIAVQENFRNQGIGKALLAYFEKLAFPAYSKVFLTVEDFNPDAMRLYERLGYIKVGEIPGLYKAGVTDYLMMKKL